MERDERERERRESARARAPRARESGARESESVREKSVRGKARERGQMCWLHRMQREKKKKEQERERGRSEGAMTCSEMHARDMCASQTKKKKRRWHDEGKDAAHVSASSSRLDGGGAVQKKNARPSAR